jgi:selenide,water dikinase
VPEETSKRDLVLVGGGHAHVHVLKRLGEAPPAGVRVTLVARDVKTPYSGLIPGFVAGRYAYDDCHVDLAPLCRRGNIRLLQGEAVGLDRDRRRLRLRDGSEVPWDVLSLDVGAAPSLDAIPGAAAWSVPVKPIAEFGRRWLAFVEDRKTWLGPLEIVVIGGGAGGVELALAIEHRLQAAARGATVRLTLATRDGILAGQAASAQRRLRAILRRRGIRVLEGQPVERIERGAVRVGETWHHADAVFVVTEAAAPAWLADTGLPLDARGFLAIRDTLQSTGDDAIFAAGDCATTIDHPRPKAGVFAVRQGPPLADNLRRVLLGEAARPWIPQARYLSIIGAGDGHAVATRGAWSVEGRWAWWWKDYIDRRWVRQYR